MAAENLEAVFREFLNLSGKSNGRCAKCGCNYAPHLSRHHVFPDQHFPGNDFVITLCRNGSRGCHNRIERRILKAEKYCGGKLSPRSYCILTERFLFEEPLDEKRKKDPYINRPRPPWRSQEAQSGGR